MIRSLGILNKSRMAAVILAGAGIVILPQATVPAQAANSPSLIVTHAPLPQNLKDKIYGSPRRVKEITPNDISGGSYYDGGTTDVRRKIDGLAGELSGIQGRVQSLSGELQSIQRDGEQKSSRYFADVATINTQLQSGTTPGNPRLVRRISDAQSSLAGLEDNVSRLNSHALQVSDTASQASVLLENARATYSLSGAVEEDHVVLANLEDEINGTIVLIDRLLNMVNDDITRTAAYLSAERDNLRTLGLAVTNGDLYGKSLTSRPFSNAALYESSPAAVMPASVDSAHLMAAPQPAMAPQAAAPLPAGGRPLVRIKFDNPNVDYEQALYVAVNEALERYPDASFDLVAVNPTQGNAAEVAIETTRARRNAEKVLRTLTQMGLPADRIAVSSDANAAARSSEVHLYIR